MIRLLIADDHPLVRRGLRDLLADTPDIAITAEASDGIEVLTLLDTHEIDVVLLDLNMPRKSGLETLVELKRLYPTLPVLIISGHCVEQYATRLGKLGAAGFVLKQDAPEQLIEAIRRAIEDMPNRPSQAVS